MMQVEIPVEKEDVRRRYDELRAVGYAWGAALHLAQVPDLDLEDARRLRALGCPQDTAVRILA